MVRRAQIREWKNRKRQELGPAEYQRQYGSTYIRDDEQRAKWRAQKREQRINLGSRQAG